MNKKIAPFGLWKSPVTPRRIASGVRIYDVGWDSDGETLVWLEGRSDRGVLVAKRRGDAPRDLTVELSVRARVGYGGGDFTVFRGDAYFVSGGGSTASPCPMGRRDRSPQSSGNRRPRSSLRTGTGSYSSGATGRRTVSGSSTRLGRTGRASSSRGAISTCSRGSVRLETRLHGSNGTTRICRGTGRG